MLLILQSPPDTSAYMIAGYTVIFGFMLLYLASLIIRSRNMQQDIEAMEEIEKRNTKK